MWAANITWQTLEAMEKSQSRFESSRPKEAVKEDNNVWRLKGNIWIPDGEGEIQIKILVTAHCGASGHRGQESAENIDSS